MFGVGYVTVGNYEKHASRETAGVRGASLCEPFRSIVERELKSAGRDALVIYSTLHVRWWRVRDVVATSRGELFHCWATGGCLFYKPIKMQSLMYAYLNCLEGGKWKPAQNIIITFFRISNLLFIQLYQSLNCRRWYIQSLIEKSIIHATSLINRWHPNPRKITTVVCVCMECASDTLAQLSFTNSLQLSHSSLISVRISAVDKTYFLEPNSLHEFLRYIWLRCRLNIRYSLSDAFGWIASEHLERFAYHLKQMEACAVV